MTRASAARVRVPREAALSVNEPLVRSEPMDTDTSVFALTAWSIKTDGTTFQIARTWHGKPKWSKPYQNLRAATQAIARKLSEELTERLTRRQRR